MPWFMDPMPDGDSVHQVAQAYQSAHATYAPHIQTTQTALTTTTTVWTGAGSAAHSRVVAATQQTANEHAGWLVTIANILYVVGTILKIIFVLQMAWLALQVLTFVSAILTAGATAAEGEAGAAMLEVFITGLRTAVQQIMEAAGKALLRLAIGATAGGLTGLGVGIYTAETNHLSGWNAAWLIGNDVIGGATAGAMVATNPIALAGTAVGVGQYATNAALGGPTSFEQAGAQWGQQTFGNIPLVGGSFASAFAPPTDVQGGFDTIVADTLAVGGVNEMFKTAETDEAGLDANAKSDGDYMAQTSRSPRVPGPRTAFGDDLTAKLSAENVTIDTSPAAEKWLNGDPMMNRPPANAAWRFNPDGSVSIALHPDYSDGEILEEYLHAQRAIARADDGFPQNLNAMPNGTEARWMEEVEVETQVLQTADSGQITLTPEERANLEGNIQSYRTDLQNRYNIEQAGPQNGQYAGQFVHVNSSGQIDEVWDWSTYSRQPVNPPVPFQGGTP